MLEFVFSEVTALKACNFIKKNRKHKCFPYNITKDLTTVFLWNTSGRCFCQFDRITI